MTISEERAPIKKTCLTISESCFRLKIWTREREKKMATAPRFPIRSIVHLPMAGKMSERLLLRCNDPGSVKFASSWVSLTETILPKDYIILQLQYIFKPFLHHFGIH
jgi:hypothetical protein